MPIETAPTACNLDPAAFDTAGESDDLRALCRACPLLASCREWALAEDVEGFAAGMTRLERRRVQSKAAA